MIASKELVFSMEQKRCFLVITVWNNPDKIRDIQVVPWFVEAYSDKEACGSEVDRIQQLHQTWLLASAKSNLVPSDIYPHTREKHDCLKRLITSVRDFQQAIAETNHILDAEEKMFAELAAYDQAPL